MAGLPSPSQLGAQFLEHELTLPLPSTEAAGPSDPGLGHMNECPAQGTT